MDFTYPIPKNSLISRFKPTFSRLSRHQNATLVALPYTGRTSLLRFISTRSDTQRLLGLDPRADRLIWLEIDRTDYSYSHFLKELAFSLSPETIPAEDDYLTSLFIHRQVVQQSSKHHLMLVITLNWKIIAALPDIDRFLVLLQKSAGPHPLNYLFSLDTTVFRAATSLHPSSAIFEKLFYFPTFSPAETVQSLKRLYLSKNLPFDTKIISRGFATTGGIAGFFHSLVNLGPDFLHHPSLNEMLTRLKSEINLSPELLTQLVTPQATRLVSTTSTQITLGSLLLDHPPTAQEINLLRLFQTKLNSPVSRDTIAACLWGNLSSAKYSDWAIDKAISRLRHLIVSKDFRLVTVKNLGYQLTNFI